MSSNTNETPPNPNDEKTGKLVDDNAKATIIRKEHHKPMSCLIFGLKIIWDFRLSF